MIFWEFMAKNRIKLQLQLQLQHYLYEQASDINRQTLHRATVNNNTIIVSIFPDYGKLYITYTDDYRYQCPKISDGYNVMRKVVDDYSYLHTTAIDLIIKACIAPIHRRLKAELQKAQITDFILKDTVLQINTAVGTLQFEFLLNYPF